MPAYHPEANKKFGVWNRKLLLFRVCTAHLYIYLRLHRLVVVLIIIRVSVLCCRFEMARNLLDHKLYLGQIEILCTPGVLIALQTSKPSLTWLIVPILVPRCKPTLISRVQVRTCVRRLVLTCARVIILMRPTIGTRRIIADWCLPIHLGNTLIRV